MEIEKNSPLTLGWIASKVRPPELSATFIVKGTFKLVPGGCAVLSEKQEFPAGDTPHPEGPEENLRYESDFAPFKPRTDLLLVGTCHASGGRPVDVCRVSFQVGSWSKTLAVIGDRAWTGSMLTTHSTPVPFTKMPLRYDRAFGGPGYSFNPIGRGVGDRRLPNIEEPSRLIHSSGDRPPVAGYGPVPRTWAQRTRNLGTYGKKWLKERWPWPPEDFDWGHHNAAPSDQQLPGYLAGNEPLVFENLHREHSRYRTSLPGLRPQVFVVEEGPGRSSPREVAFKLDTLWVDMDAETLILVWRGLTPVRSLKMTEIAEVHLLHSPLSQPPVTWELYRAEADRKEAEARQAEEQEQAVEREEEKKFDAEMAPLAKALEGADAHAASVLAQVRQVAAKLGVAVPAIPTAPAAVPQMGPVFDLSKHLAASTARDPMIAEAVAKFPKIEISPLPELPGEDVWTRERCRAHAEAGGSFSERDLSKLDLSGLDLSGLDFSKADLSGANLKEAKLVKAVLSGADLSKADLSSADLSEADLRECDASRANLAKTRMTKALLDRAGFRKAVLAEAVLDGVSGELTDFSGADLTQASLRESRFVQADFIQCRLERADFTRAVLADAVLKGAAGPGIRLEEADVTGLRVGTGADFAGGNFQRIRGAAPTWGGAVLDEADFRMAAIPRADFTFASLRGARLDGSDLRNASFADAALERASLTSANLMRASFERANLRGADLQMSNLYEAEFWDAKTEGAGLRGANLKMTKLAGGG